MLPSIGVQIPRILNPIAEAVRSLEEMALDPVIGDYVEDGWGGVHNAKMAVLSDFFKVRDCPAVHLSLVLQSWSLEARRGVYTGI